ncbi:FadR/GntR family transcriptional regulator [Sphingomonas psychrotolerans]|uniref:GntR family transcriptional regulator n=1 Tax=Sphingomonas psychrotolerans TaxID=1327635 RepID=A0A2K8MJ96_9SPHN|nr:FadR/GntR family transcriptional regulator [Sphingomonas psychrotolerans]ATY33962.1 GntR family transcriptional regulator [Sphingomonas psychrotolerans]
MADRRLFQDIAEQISAMIAEGAFPPGSRLPGERELAERLGVSRVTIREAEIALQAQGLVRIKTGSGVYVCEPSDHAAGSLPVVSAFELTEARALFESEAAALAAPTISDEQIEVLETLVAAMSEADDGSPAATEADRAFHLTIASASGNQAIIFVINSLWRMRTEIPEICALHASVCGHDEDTRHDEHAAVLDALKNRDSVAARAAMRKHFGRLLEAMLKASEEQEMLELRRKSEASRSRFLISAQLG